MGAGRRPRTAADGWQVAHAERAEATDRVHDSRLCPQLLEDCHRAAHQCRVMTLDQGARLVIRAAHCMPGSRCPDEVASDLESVWLGQVVSGDGSLASLP